MCKNLPFDASFDSMHFLPAYTAAAAMDKTWLAEICTLSHPHTPRLVLFDNENVSQHGEPMPPWTHKRRPFVKPSWPVLLLLLIHPRRLYVHLRIRPLIAKQLPTRLRVCRGLDAQTCCLSHTPCV